MVLLTHFAREPDRVMRNAPELAAAAHLPLPTVSKILKILAREGLLVPHRGAKGGFSLARPATENQHRGHHRRARRADRAYRVQRPRAGAVRDRVSLPGEHTVAPHQPRGVRCAARHHAGRDGLVAAGHAAVCRARTGCSRSRRILTGGAHVVRSVIHSMILHGENIAGDSSPTSKPTSLRAACSEDIVRLISAKKNEPEFMLEWRLQGVSPLADARDASRRADVGEHPLSRRSTTRTSSTTRRRSRRRRSRAWTRSIRSCARTFEKLGISARRAEAPDRASRSTRSSTASRWPPRSRRSSPRRASSSARSPTR